MNLRKIGPIVALAAASLCASSQANVEEQAIHKFFADADVAWNKHDAKLLTNEGNAAADADFVNVFGGWAKGRDNFVALMSKLQAGPFHDDTRQTVVEQVKFVRPDVAVVITKILDRVGEGPQMQTRGTFVLSKEHGVWLLDSFQNTKIVENSKPMQPVPSAATAAH